MEKHLYIIGNGFDMHHGINSSYQNFREWLYDNEPSVIEEIEEAYGFCEEEWWSDFENQLSSLDILEYAGNIAYENQPNIMSDHCDSTWNDAEIEVEQSLDGLYSDLRGCFRNWILQLKEPQEDKRIELIRKNSRFLTFNYSKTLENMYDVSSAQILHIHGCIDDNEEFILGHCAEKDDLWKMIVVNDPEPPCNEDIEAYEQWQMEMEQTHQLHQQLAETAAVNGVASQKKPVGELLYKYRDFFDGLNDITHVHVYGMSFSQVDAPYLARVAGITGNAEWEISDYNGDCEKKIKSFVDKHRIRNFKIIELNDLISKHQLKIEFPME